MVYYIKSKRIRFSFIHNQMVEKKKTAYCSKVVENLKTLIICFFFFFVILLQKWDYLIFYLSIRLFFNVILCAQREGYPCTTLVGYVHTRTLRVTVLRATRLTVIANRANRPATSTDFRRASARAPTPTTRPLRQRHDAVSRVSKRWPSTRRTRAVVV